MAKKNLLSILASLLCLTSFGQWSALTTGTAHDFTSVYFVNQNTGFAGTTYSEIFKTTDGGATWNLSGTASGAVYSLFFATDSVGYAAGAGGTMSKTTDGGITWAGQSTGQGYQITSVYFHGKDTGFATTQNGGILRTNNGGSFWFAQTSGTSYNLNSIFFTDLNNGWAVGSTGTILHTTDGGATWNPQSSGSGAILNSVFFTSAFEGFVCGQGGNMLHTSDGGSTWSSTYSSTTNDLYSIHFTDAYHGYACGMTGTVIKTFDAGGMWYSQNTGTVDNLSGIFFIDINTGYAAGINGTIIKTTIGGCNTPVVTIGGNTNVCAGNTMFLYGTGASTYRWDANGGNAITDTTFISPFSSEVVSVIGTTTDGCFDTGFVNVNVLAPPGITNSWSGIPCYGMCNGSITANPTGAAPFTYSWSNGGTTQTITNLCAGNYTIIVTDMNGCSSSAWTPLSEPPPLVAGASATAATCVGVNDGSVVDTSSGGSAPYNYLWMPGSITSPSPGSLAVGIYTLTITDQASCTSTTTVNIGNLSGNVILIINSATTTCKGQPTQLTYNILGGTAPFSNNWYDYGQGNSFCSLDTAILSPVISGTDTVMLTVTDNVGCIFMANQYIAVAPGDSISGIVRDSSNVPVTAGNVYLFQQKTNHVGVSDTVAIAPIQSNGTYTFPDVIYGDYFIMVDADTSVAAYKTAIPTYYSNKTYPFQWDSALAINHYTCGGGNQSGIDVKIIQLPGATSGPGQISGHISEGVGFGQRLGHGHNAPLGAPLKGVDIKLGKNPGGSPVARTTSDNNGDYQFNNIPVGNYKIYVNIPNYGMDSVLAISITSTSTVSTNNNYYVDSLMVRVDTASNVGVHANASVAGNLFVYPNPASSSVTLTAQKELGMVTILNSLGQAVYKETVRSSQQHIDIANLPAGIYIITVHGKFIRLVKE
ncbi:MAG: YCF48-related protein [Bacteroidia bacterium]